MDERRARARALAARALAAGAPVAWFDELYREAAAGAAIVPWDDGSPNPLLVRWLDRHPGAPGRRALDVGCGTGDNTAELARRGFRVTAFDVSPAAVEVAKERVGARPDVSFRAADALHLPAEWRRAFDLVVEVYTLQVLPPAERAVAARALADAVAPGGTLVVIARGRELGDPEGEMPWPLLHAELEAIADDDLRGDELRMVEFEDLLDDEAPPVRRFVATFERLT
jgi:SAM-dependent methyltransferase